MKRTIALTVTALALLACAVASIPSEESHADPATETWYVYGSTMILTYPYEATDVEWRIDLYSGQTQTGAVSRFGKSIEYDIPDGCTLAKVKQIVKDSSGSGTVSMQFDVVPLHLKSGETISVRFWNNGSVYYTYTLDSASAVKVGTAFVIPPTEPTRAGFAFQGWFADSTCVTPFNMTDIVTHDADVYSGWSATGEHGGQKVTVNDHVVTFQTVNGLEYGILENTGTSVRFTVSKADGFEFDMSSIVVMANSSALVPVDGVYSLTDIREDVLISIAGVEIFTIQYDLSHVSVSAPAMTVSGPFNAEVESDFGWNGLNIRVYMGGKDVTSAYVDGDRISIDKVTANIVVVADAGTPWLYLAMGAVLIVIVATAAIFSMKRRNKK